MIQMSLQKEARGCETLHERREDILTKKVKYAILEGFPCIVTAHQNRYDDHSFF